MATHVCYIEWHVHPLRTDRWFEEWKPAAERAMAFGAKDWSLTRDHEDPLHFRQATFWEKKSDFEDYWFSDEVSEARERVLSYYNKPLLPVWHELVASD